jgi:hypothetical protein
MSSLRQLYPHQLTARQARHLNTMAAMISGIVLAQSSHLERIARKIPEKTQVESRIKQFTRFNQNQQIAAEAYYLPFLEMLIAGLATSGSITLAMDGSETGRNCMTLMVSLIYRKRALPIAWLTVRGKKGHLAEAVHIKLLKKVQALFPQESHVVFLGDGEFDGIDLQAAIAAAGWEYVCRTARNRIINDDGDQFALSDIALAPGNCIDMPDVGFTYANYGPVMVIAWWCKGHKEPIYLVTNMECTAEACHWYRRRFRIETFFSDQKSRGFNLQKSHLADPNRLERFLIPACLAYIWMIYLGVKVQANTAIMQLIHRVDRCDLSLFQLGLRYLQHLLNYEEPVPFSLAIPA